ncbi:MAG: nicotinamide mononucleotide transporter [Bacteroidaceae bacterium]|nr:nicotinamide mononucleotide transporter [Bacteroidales bacterium]MCF0184877.1 nicotinamide mononucleotide transporter [Bacteroidaceae bacterium]
MLTEEKFNKYFSIFILAGMSIALIVTTFIKASSSSGRELFWLIFSAVGSLCGVIATILSANGKISTFVFGFFDVSIYAAACFVSARYGNAALHVLYFVPMQFVGIAQWRKRGASSHTAPKAKRLTPKQWAVYMAFFLLGSIVSYIILAQFDKSAADTFLRVAVILDVMPLMCNIIGQLLMSTAYMEQWIFWILVNVGSIAMWSSTLATSGDSYAVIYIIKYVFYLLNSLNGLRIWLRLSR